jgi:hypothetical protein
MIRQLLCPERFIPVERAPSIHWVRGWVGVTSSLDIVVKRKIPVFAHFRPVS